jgi:predicted N-acetyltransferase YhbS
MANLVYRDYEPNDAEQLCHLHQSVFGVSRAPDFWHWKYDSNPAGKDMNCVAEDTETGQLVGEAGILPVRVGVRGEPVIATQALDILVDEQYRHRRVFLNLYRRAWSRIVDSGAAFSFAFAVETTVRVSTKLMKFTSVAPIPRMVKPLSLIPYVPRRLAIAARFADPLFRIATRPPRVRVPKGAAIQPITRFGARYDLLWARLAPTYPVAVWRDSAYLNWRYIDVPGSNCQAFALERQGEVLGFTVLRGATVKGRKRGRILELVAIDNDEAVAAALLTHALGEFHAQGLTVADCWVFAHHPLWRTTREFGFWPRPRRGRELIARTANGRLAADFLTDAHNWVLSMGDSDEI